MIVGIGRDNSGFPPTGWKSQGNQSTSLPGFISSETYERIEEAEGEQVI